MAQVREEGKKVDLHETTGAGNQKKSTRFLPQSVTFTALTLRTDSIYDALSIAAVRAGDFVAHTALYSIRFNLGDRPRWTA